MNTDEKDPTMEKHRASDTDDVKIRMDNRIPTWGIITALAGGALFVASLLVTIVITQAGTNQTMGRVGDDVKEIKADLKVINSTQSAAAIAQGELKNQSTSIERRVTAIESQLQIIRSK